MGHGHTSFAGLLDWSSRIGLLILALVPAACGNEKDPGPGGTGAIGGSGAAGGTSGKAGTSGTGGTNSAGTGGVAGTGGATPEGFCSALAVVRDKCQACHGSERAFGAPMSLTKYEDFVANAPTNASKKVFQLIRTRIHDVQRPMPPVGYPALTASELSTLDQWIAQGAALGSADPMCGGQPNPDPKPDAGPAEPPPVDCEQTYRLVAGQNGQKQSVPAGQETHPQFVFTPPWPGEAQALVFRPIVDNKKIVHHWILYSGEAFLAGWAPGQDVDRVRLPPDVGMYLPSPGSGLQLQLDVHYNNLGGTTEELDASGVEICVITSKSKFRPKMASVFRWFSALPLIWPRSTVDNFGTCRVRTTNGPLHILTSSPHMHKLGVHAKFEVTRTDGTTTTIHDKPFAFEDQRTFMLTPEVLVNTGDVITTTCRYTNPTAQFVTYGDSTEGEMCFNFALYYPMDGFYCEL
jgi:hypothetical protein